MGLHEGATVAGYRIAALLGRGGSGWVYAADDPALQRRVALKVLAPGDPAAAERFLHDARLAGALDHPHILPVLAAGESDGAHYLVTRYVDGGDLAARLAHGPPAAHAALAIAAQIGSALDAAHARGLVHGDVKPANILLSGDGEHAYLCDFGAAGSAVAQRAPEQLAGGPVDGRADGYALACVLFECLTGRPPFARDNELATILAHRAEAPPRASVLRPELPPALDGVLARELAKDPAARYASCAAFVADARKAVEGAEAAPHTFVFADIRGYTAYTREHGDEVSAGMLRRFAAIVQRTAQATGGTVTQYRGDEALTVFPSPRSALRFALALQRAVAEERLPCGVGVGLDAGEAVAVGADFHGTAVNRAARLCALARAGEVLASDGVVHLASTFGDARYGLRRLERLKGFAQPVGVNEVHPPAAAPGRQLRRRAARALRGAHPRVRLAAAALVLVAGVATALALSAGGGTGHAAPRFSANSIALLDARTGAPEGTADPGLHVCVFATAMHDLWACDADQSIVLRVDGRSHRVVDQIPLPTYHGSFTVAFGSVWVGDIATPTVRRVSVRYRTASPAVRLRGVPPVSPDGAPEGVDALAATPHAVWAAYGFPKRIARLDPGSGRVTFTRPLRQSCPCVAALAAGAGQLWAVGGDGLHLYRLDPATGATIASGRLHGGSVTGAAVAGGYLWVTLAGDDGVWKVDQSGSAVDHVHTGRSPGAPTAGGGYLWVANTDGGTVTRVDPRTDAARTFPVGHRPLAVAELAGTVYVGLAPGAADAARQIAGPRVVRGMAADLAGGVDPVSYGSPPDLSVGAAAGAGLMALVHRAGGTTAVVPELAAAPPAVSDGGRTYTFRLRPGLRFSSGAPVTADAVRASLERAVAPGLLNHYCRDGLLGDVAGQAAYEAGRADRIAGIRAAGARVAITLVRPSATLPARLTNPCLSVLPAETPLVPVGLSHPIPSAGPYYVAALIPGEELVLRRNRFYRGPRRARLDTIVLSAGDTPQQGAAAVEAGRADFAADPGAPPIPDFQPGGRLDRRYGRAGGRMRYAVPPSPETVLLGFDSRRGLFADTALRRAVNLGLDRRALAAALHGTPRSSLIPPGIPGYSPRQPYPAQDLRRARALARGHGGVATLVASSFVAPALATLRPQLARIGVGVRARILPQGAPPSAAPADLVLSAWAPDYPDPYDMVNVLLDPAVSVPGVPKLFADPRWLARMRAAAAAPLGRRAAAYARLDRALALGPAPLAVLGSRPGVPELVSSRLGCISYDLGRLDLAGLCLQRAR